MSTCKGHAGIAGRASLSHVPQCCSFICCRKLQAVVCHETARPTNAH